MSDNADSERSPWITYRRADGLPIMGEYEFMTDPVCFEDDDEWCVEVVEETWQLVGSRILKYGRCDRWCKECDEDVKLAEPTNEKVLCDACRALQNDGVERER